MKFIHNPVNAVASGKFDRQTEKRLSPAMEEKFPAIAAHLPAKAIMGIVPERSQHVGPRQISTNARECINTWRTTDLWLQLVSGFHLTY
jgi:hypothetical protein